MLERKGITPPRLGPVSTESVRAALMSAGSPFWTMVT